MQELSERATCLGNALAAAGGTAVLVELGAALGFDHNRLYRAAKDLQEADLAVRRRRKLEFTPTGRQVFSRWPRPDVGEVGRILSFWPARHRAAAELLVSAVIARRHLPHLRPPPGFVFIGRTAMGKTELVKTVMELLGLDQVKHRLIVAEQTEGDIFGRRYQGEGGQWKLDPSPITLLPMVFFDEFDKAEPSLQMMVWTYFQAERDVQRTGLRVRIDPVPVIAANYPAGRDRYSQLRPEYLRRAITLDVGSDRTSTAHLEEALTAFYEPDRAWRGRFLLEQLAPTAHEAPDVRGFLASVPMVLTEEGIERFVGAGPLEALVLGRSPLYPGVGLGQLAVVTVTDYLTCLESIEGLVTPDWYDVVERVADRLEGAGRAEVEARISAARQARSQQAETVRRATVRQEVETLEHIKHRSAFIEGLTIRYDRLDGRGLHKDFRDNEKLRSDTRGVRDQIRRLIASAANVGPYRLEELKGVAQGPMAGADELWRSNEQFKRQEKQRREEDEQTKAADRQRRAFLATQVKLREQARKESLRRRLAEIQDNLRLLEGYWRRRSSRKGEDTPLAILRGLDVDGQPVIIFRELEPLERERGFRGFFTFLGNAVIAGQGTWHSPHDPSIRFPGTATTCPALATWGPATQRVLGPVIATMHTIEDQLSAELGRPVRRRRPSVSSGRQATNTYQLPQPVPLLALTRRSGF
jgi:hypothetical protein